MELKSKNSIRIAAEDSGAAAISFDLSKLKLNREEMEIARKLFMQDPVVLLAEGEHRHDKEKGKTGPASKYLTAAEFEKIRTIGVRLGTAGELAATACDFCLHCVKLEALGANGRTMR